ncbi:hypothetical protein GNI_169810 [Gregarina niphandrodes]|uniref:Uncharacterized protein n=1 Tax=Gregarina niphandrodes TaxID=110365 RepID=A0A023AYI7_GRENI|nr:hypothetical protein GNI_169810 [Gregarina niphandrodes]EZG43498.1 hypothetical protein GNI_169810 [Gregarina niphandrodes]|eukprot:XP_011133271.1 hypothetical protein GNI_169810 [Gregarina niphandrodes]
MRGSCATETEEVSPLLSVLTGFTFDVASPGEQPCASLTTKQVLLDRRLEAPRGCPPPMPDCVRLGFGDGDKITPRLFLTVALQTLDGLMKERGWFQRHHSRTLFSLEQIQVKTNDVKPEVVLDLADVAKYDDFKEEAADETERLRKAQEVFLKLATAGHLDDAGSREWRVIKKIMDALQAPMSYLGDLHNTLLNVYRGYEASGDYKSGVWKGICRPMLNVGGEVEQVMVAPSSKPLCPRCDPGPLVSLPVPGSVTHNVMTNPRSIPNANMFVPAHARVPISEWGVEGPSGEVYTLDGKWPVWDSVQGTWGEEVIRASKMLTAEAEKQGVQVTEYPWTFTWDNTDLDMKFKCDASQEDCGEKVRSVVDKQIKLWRVANLGDLVKSYRLSPQLVKNLEKQAELLGDLARNRDLGDRGWYIGSYAQAYVMLEFDEHGKSSLRSPPSPIA